jgi:hypothetical protein
LPSMNVPGRLVERCHHRRQMSDRLWSRPSASLPGRGMAFRAPSRLPAFVSVSAPRHILSQRRRRLKAARRSPVAAHTH